MNTDSPADNDALEGPIVPTFIRYMMPSLLGMIAMTSGSLVDGMFIGNYIERDGETLALALEFVAYIWPVFIFAGFTMWISGYLNGSASAVSVGTRGQLPQFDYARGIPDSVLYAVIGLPLCCRYFRCRGD